MATTKKATKAKKKTTTKKTSTAKTKAKKAGLGVTEHLNALEKAVMKAM